MSKNESNPESDPLSATGMFLQALGSRAEPSASATNALTNASGAANGGSGSKGESPEVAAAAGSEAPTGPGEFTRLFQSAATEDTGTVREVAEPSFPVASQPGVENPPSVPDEARQRDRVGARDPAGEPGEFTRIFLSGSGRAQVPPKTAEEGQRTRAGGGGRAKGFSSPGASDSASAEGGVTQLFRPIAAGGPSRASQADTRQPGASPSGLASAPAAKDNAAFSTGTASPSSPSPSITNLIESLASPGGSAGEPERAERPLYASEPPASAAAWTPAAAGPGTGGVTGLIQKLGDESPSSAPVRPASAAPVPIPPANAGSGAGPGEYTRVIARIEEPAAAAVPQAAVAAASAAAAAVGAARIPAAPKLAAPPMPAPAMPTVAPPKTKLEAMVPGLLVANTVLLLAVLAVLMLLLHAK